MAKANQRPDAKAKATPPPAPQSSPEGVVAPAIMLPLDTQAETQAKPSPRAPIWLTALLLLGLLAVLVWVLYRGFGGSEPDLTNSQLATPAAGGMLVESTAAGSAATPDASATITSTISELTQPTGLQPGQTVAASSAGELRLYSDATSTSPIRDVYAAGALFTVLEPSGQYTAYPVIVNDQQWYRVRAADGLVGWATLGAFTPATDVPQATSTATG